MYTDVCQKISDKFNLKPRRKNVAIVLIVLKPHMEGSRVRVWDRVIFGARVRRTVGIRGRVRIWAWLQSLRKPNHINVVLSHCP